MLHRLLIPTAIALILFAAGCGDGSPSTTSAASLFPADAAESTPTPEPQPTAEPEPTVEPQPTAEPEPTGPTEPTATAEPTPEPEPTVEPEPSSAPTPDEREVFDAPGALELRLPIDPAAAPGTIIDVEELTIPGAVGNRILYHSTSAQGEPVAVSGFVSLPAGDAPEGGWPLIAWAHGTTGLGDRCAPSIEAETDEISRALVAFGYAVVATDYEGLGTPGTHPYVVGASEAHSVLDSVRAVRALGLPVSREWIAFGHSQGGHAAMFTGQLQPTYAPELDLIGVVAGAPPSQLEELNQALIGGDYQGYLIMTAAGLAAADPAVQLEAVLSADALELLDVVESGCTEDIFEVYNPLAYDEVMIVDNPFALPEWGDALRANDTNLLPVEVPLMIIHGGDDEQIPVESSGRLLEQLCAFPEQGPTIRNVYEGQTHAGVLTTFAAVPDLLSWVQDRFADEAAPDDCDR